MVTKKKIYTWLFCFAACLIAIDNIKAQSCAGSWALQRPASDPCVTGQWVGQAGGNPTGCPVNPSYTALQTNTFTFTDPVSTFSIDFSGFDGSVQCPRMEIKINGVFYPLSITNISDVTPGPTCTGFFSTIVVTSDGYLTTSNTLYSQGRITITNVNASSVTVSSNDGQGTVFSNPFGCTTVPLILEFFSGNTSNNCKALLRWKSGIELNVKNIELLRSVNGTLFNKVATVSPKGDNSNYSIETDNREDAFFRLKINDLDGHYEYSDIIRVKSGCANTIYQITPNPVNSLMEIAGLEKDDRVSIKNTLGQTVLIFNAPQNINKFNMQKLAQGLYFVQIQNSNGGRANFKIIKN